MADSQVFYLKMLERFQSAPASALQVCNISCHSFFQCFTNNKTFQLGVVRNSVKILY